MPVLSNLTGASQGTGAGKRLFLSRPYVDGADAGDGVEALVTSGDDLRQLTGDPPAAPFHVLGAEGRAPGVRPPGRRPADHPTRRARPARPPGGSSWPPTRRPTSPPSSGSSPRRPDDDAFSFANADGTPRTPTRVFEVHLRNRWTTWRYRDKGDGSVTSTEADPLPLTHFGNAGTQAEAVDRRHRRRARHRRPAEDHPARLGHLRLADRSRGRKVMATTYKTPGVYIEEIPKFPPSVAPVDTAIPAFIGYTEKAIDAWTARPDAQAQADRVAGRVRAVLRRPAARDRRSPSPIDETTEPTPGKPVGVTATAALDEDDRSKHILYYALQLFYANGGKSCYIVSVGPYKAVGADLDVARARGRADPAGQGRRADPDRHPRGAGAPGIADFATLQTDALAQCDDAQGPLRDHGRPRRRRVAVGPRTPTCSPRSPTSATDGLGTEPQVRRRLRAEPRDDPRLRLRRGADDSLTHTVDGAHGRNDSRSSPISRPRTTSSTSGPRRRSAPAADAAAERAMAGVYAKVDADRGVWKAPANVAAERRDQADDRVLERRATTT